MSEFRKLDIDVGFYRSEETCDVLILGHTTEYKKWLPRVKSLENRGTKVIYDVTNDPFSGWKSYAVRVNYRPWEFYKPHLYSLRWGFLQSKLRLGNWGRARDFFRSCSALVTSSAALARRFSEAGARANFVIEPVVFEEFSARAQYLDRKPVTLVWDGARDNLVYFIPYLGTLRLICKSGLAKLRVITDRYRSTPHKGILDNQKLLKFWGLDAEFLEWKSESFAQHLAEGDIGIAPLPTNDPISQIKASTKILTYAYMGIPVIASPIDSYRDAISVGRFGVLASDERQWIDAVRSLGDVETRKTYGLRGRKYVQESATPEIFARQYLEVIHKSVGLP